MGTISIRPAEGTWTVRAGGAVLGESDNALSVEEDGYPFVIYFRREDIAMDFLDRSDKVTTCPRKGDATHYSIATRSATLENVAWSYETPNDDVRQIAGHIAFYASDAVTVERI